ncbi:hypothetical protein [Aeromicrobium halocynthiae]|uniref:hypothetical protein n=1 Tax=Aeromicrobium halocynthiae TaxID=560557 RepID=UPI0031D1ABEA
MSPRPRLVDGAVVVRRDAHHLLVGTDPGVVVPDRPGLLALLRCLDGVRDVGVLQAMAEESIAADVPQVLQELAARGVLTVAPDRPVARLTVVLRAGPGCTALEAVLRQSLDDLPVVPAGPDGPGLVLQLSSHEPPRSLLDALVRDGRPHLLVRRTGRGWRVGPYVAPGHSPCVRCADLARIDVDPQWAAVLPQLEVPPLLAARDRAGDAAAWETAALVGREVVRAALGVRPRSVGAVLRHGEDDGWHVHQPVAFHHRCGCWLLGAR